MKKYIALAACVLLAVIVLTDGLHSQITPGLSTGPSTFVSPSVTTAATVNANPGDVYSYFAENVGASSCTLEFFNAASGSVVLGTTTPIWFMNMPVTSGAPPFAANLSGGPASIFAAPAALSVAAETTYKSGSACGANIIQVSVGYK